MAQQRSRRSSITRAKKDSTRPQMAKISNGKALSDGDSGQVGQMVSIGAVKVATKQPRRFFDPTRMQQLTESIHQYGVLEPLIVRPVGESTYEIVAGERRYRAAERAGLETIPVIVRDVDEQQAFELALLENLQRDDLNPIDETEGFLDLLSQSLGGAGKSLEESRQEVISLLNRAANAQKRGQELTDNDTRQLEVVDRLFRTVGRLNRESFRTNRLPLLNLPSDVLEVLRKGELEYTKAKAIARLQDANQRAQLMQQAIDEKLSLSEVKQRIKQFLEQHQGARKPRNLREELKELTRIKSIAWNDGSKRQRIEELLAEFKKILES